MKRNNQIHFYLSDKEYEKLHKRITKSGLSLSAYMRHLIHDKVPQDKPPKEYFDTLKELRFIGRNINQIALVANSTGIIDSKRYDEQYRELLRLILNLIDAAEMPRDIVLVDDIGKQSGIIRGISKNTKEEQSVDI